MKRRVFWLPPVKRHLDDERIIEEVERLEGSDFITEIETGGTIIRDTGNDDGRWEILHVSRRGYVWKNNANGS